MLKEEGSSLLYFSRSKIMICIGLSLLFMVMSLLIWHQRYNEVLLSISHNWVYEQHYENIFQIISQGGMSFILLLYIALMFIENKKTTYSSFAPLFLCLFLTFLFAGLFTDVIKIFIDKPRPPEALFGLTTLDDIPETASFPSGHTTKAMALVLPFLVIAINRTVITRIIGLTTIFTALSVAYSRIALQKHFLSDVVAGTGVALLFIPLGILFTNAVLSKWPDFTKRLLRPHALLCLYLITAVILAFASF